MYNNRRSVILFVGYLENGILYSLLKSCGRIFNVLKRSYIMLNP